MFRIPALDLSAYTAEEQMKKILEETAEVYEAFEGGNKDDISEECLDIIQSALGLLLMISPKPNELIRKFIRHELKLKQREAQGKIKITGWFQIEEKDGY